jgi:hypothetical protein
MPRGRFEDQCIQSKLICNAAFQQLVINEFNARLPGWRDLQARGFLANHARPVLRQFVYQAALRDAVVRQFIERYSDDIDSSDDLRDKFEELRSASGTNTWESWLIDKIKKPPQNLTRAAENERQGRGLLRVLTPEQRSFTKEWLYQLMTEGAW